MRLNVFDLDHTLITVNSSFRFGLYLYKKKFFSFRKMLGCMTLYARHKWFGMPVQLLHKEAFTRLFKGHSLETMSHYIEQFLSEHLNEIINTGVLKILKDSQMRGEYTMILSTSPDFLVGAISRILNVDLWKATSYCVNSNGELMEIDHIFEGEQKAKHVKEFAFHHSLPLSAITAYSDSILDLPLLEVAGKAVGVNPDRCLKRICKKNNWKIM